MTQPWDENASLNPARAPHFRDVVATRLSRRRVLAGGAALAAAGTVGTSIFGAPAFGGQSDDLDDRHRADSGGRLLGFRAVPLSTADTVVVPEGYTAVPFIPWGTPILGDHPDFRPGENTAREQEQQVGMHHDGMHYFPLGNARKGSRRGLLVVNHEYTDEAYLHGGRPDSTPPAAEDYDEDMVALSQAAHGVSVVEVERDGDGTWRAVRSKRNRRVTATTEMKFAGPATGHRLLRTEADDEGRHPVGTFNNCSNGFTPWDTYLTCEENFNEYFALDEDVGFDLESAELIARYGVGGDKYHWAAHDDRFTVSADEPNEPNRFGWVVEIEPFDRDATPVKRTALGRLKHEGAFVHVTKGGRVVVYMGDDQVNEYVYKFVSKANWRTARMRGDSPLDEGTLYVGRFNDDGTGDWLPLVHGEGPLTEDDGWADQGEVLIKARLAATAVGATPMDRPEWTSVDPTTGLVYLTCTNNTDDAKLENEANPRMPNPWGHIIRWKEKRGDHTATEFSWDLFLLAGQGRDSDDGSTIDARDAFGSPDGLWVDPDGRVWIQTDGDQPEGAHNQMLAADPNENGRRPRLRRFLTGPVASEITGITATPDQRTMFVNVQHPGDSGDGGGSTWPGVDGLKVPRSSTVVITKDDGGIVGT